MYDVNFAVLARRVIIDSSTKQLSLIDLFDGANAHTFPIVMESLSAVFQIHRDLSDPDIFESSVRYFINNQEIGRHTVPLDFKSDKKVRSIVGFEGFVIPSPGTLKIALFNNKDDSELISLLVDIEKIDTPKAKMHISEI